VASSLRASSDLRNRAIHLLETAFAQDNEPRARQYYFDVAFGDLHPNPIHQIEFSGPVAHFAAHAVDRLLAHECIGRGEHALSRLLTTIVSLRGRQAHPDFHDLPLALNECCALPTRAEEHRYLTRLIRDIEAKARLYSPLSGIANTRPTSAAPEPWADDPALASLIRHQSRKKETREAATAASTATSSPPSTTSNERPFWARPAPARAPPSASSP